MKIKWFGHDCFLFTSSSGTRILTDPFGEDVGYPLPQLESDIVTISHDHYDHNNAGSVKGKFELIKVPGIFKCRDIEVKGISTFHDENGGSERGVNIVYVYDIDGIKICHCGDLGHILNKQQIEELGHVDILLIPVGGIYTIDSEKAIQVIKLIKPAVAIPMHYKTKHLSFELDGVQKFLKGVKGEKICGSEISIKKEELSSYPEVIVFDYK